MVVHSCPHWAPRYVQIGSPPLPTLGFRFCPIWKSTPVHRGRPTLPNMDVQPRPSWPSTCAQHGSPPASLALHFARLGGRPFPAPRGRPTLAVRGCHFRLWPSIVARLGGRPTLAALIGSPPPRSGRSPHSVWASMLQRGCPIKWPTIPAPLCDSTIPPDASGHKNRMKQPSPRPSMRS